MLDALGKRGIDPQSIIAVGHRIVHGGARFEETVRIDDTVESGLREIEPLAPNHVPRELAAIDAVRAHLGDVTQIAVFDTTFHRTLPPEVYTYPGPFEWLARGIRRYGFHGINVAYCVERAAHQLERPATELRLVVCHLGGGCSVTAVRAGASIDTSMGFTPLDGMMMVTRAGSLDPGILLYLMRTDHADAGRLDDLLNHECGFVGLAGTSDVAAVVRSAAAGDARTRLALGVFTQHLAATIAGMLPALGSLDALVFTAGIGEHAESIRADVCARLAFVNIPRVLVIPANEEWYIARECARVLEDVGIIEPAPQRGLPL